MTEKVVYKSVVLSGGKIFMLYADEWNKYKAEKRGITIGLYKVNWFEKILLKIMGYKITKLPELTDKN